MRIVQQMFSRKWLLTTVLVVVAVGVMIRLGIWQLDRLERRRAFNARVMAQTSQPELALEGEALAADLENMEYRSVVVRGEYDHSQEVALRNQVKDSQWGVHLITPLRIEGSDRAVLVDRGWIPAEDFTAGNWEKYAEPGIVEVRGMIRASQTRPDIGNRQDVVPAEGEPPLAAWHMVNVLGIDKQVSYDLLPVYVQQAPDPAWTGLPARTLPDLELSEGPHMGYAMQWFLFAGILGIGYPFFLRRQNQLSARGEEPIGLIGGVHEKTAE